MLHWDPSPLTAKVLFGNCQHSFEDRIYHKFPVLSQHRLYRDFPEPGGAAYFSAEAMWINALFARFFAPSLPFDPCVRHAGRQMGNLGFAAFPCFHLYAPQHCGESAERPQHSGPASHWCQHVLGPDSAELQSRAPHGPAEQALWRLCHCCSWRTSRLGVLDPFQTSWEVPPEWVHAGLDGAARAPVADVWGDGWPQACSIPVCGGPAAVGWVEDTFLWSLPGSESSLPPCKWRNNSTKLGRRCCSTLCFASFQLLCSASGHQNHRAQDLHWAWWRFRPFCWLPQAKQLDRWSIGLLCVVNRQAMAANLRAMFLKSVYIALYGTESAKSLLYSRGCRRWFLDVLIPRCSSCLARPVQNMARCQCWVSIWTRQVDPSRIRRSATYA